jgi:hypothetical protein
MPLEQTSDLLLQSNSPPVGSFPKIEVAAIITQNKRTD